jgi:hypothetical protein
MPWKAASLQEAVCELYDQGLLRSSQNRASRWFSEGYATRPPFYISDFFPRIVRDMIRGVSNIHLAAHKGEGWEVRELLAEYHDLDVEYVDPEASLTDFSHSFFDSLGKEVMNDEEIEGGYWRVAYCEYIDL